MQGNYSTLNSENKYHHRAHENIMTTLTHSVNLEISLQAFIVLATCPSLAWPAHSFDETTHDPSPLSNNILEVVRYNSFIAGEESPEGNIFNI